MFGKTSKPSTKDTLFHDRTLPVIRDRNSRKRVTVRMADAPPEAATQQQWKKECDINEIVNRASRGIAPKFVNKGTPRYGDFSNVPSLEAAYDRIKSAEAAFMTLPSKLRLELGNDPRNIDQLTKEQLERFKLLKEPAEPTEPNSPSQRPPSSSSAGQAQPAGTEPAAKKGGKTAQD